VSFAGGSSAEVETAEGNIAAGAFGPVTGKRGAGERRLKKRDCGPPPQGEYRKSMVRRDSRKAANATNGGIRKREHIPHPRGGISRIDVVGR